MIIRKMRSAMPMFRTILAILSLASMVFGQSNDGSITGTVKDKTGASVPGATVTIANPEIGVTQKASTSEAGTFVFPLVPAGTYTITVENTGFKKYEKSNVILTTGVKLSTGDLVLEVGGSNETVTVQADMGQLQIKSESGERSDMVSGKQLREIGLNGRNVTDLAKLIPGVISGGASSGNGSSTVNNIAGSFNINGTRSSMHEYTVDGVTNFNLGNNTGALVSVNPDALEEVRILTSNYQAEYGRSGGGFIALTTRSGTNEYHGSGRYFRRHDSMNANNFFNNIKGQPRPLYRYNFVGWDFGGPIPFLGTKNARKLFFFVNQEYYKQLVPQSSAVNIRVPTDAEKAGDFSQSVDGAGKAMTIKDPTTGLQFPGNKIPTSRLYASGVAVLKLLPAPNAAVGANTYNYTSQVPSAYPRRENIIRVDYQIASTTRLSGRWIHNFDEQQQAYGTTTASWNWPLTIAARQNGPGNVLSFTLAHAFNPSLVNEFTYGAGRGGVNIAPVGDAVTRSVTGINTPLLYPDANIAGYIPSLNFGSIASTTAVANTSLFGPFNQSHIINNFIDNLSKVWRKHVFKFGVYYQRASNSSNSQNNVESNIDFSNNASNPLNTGHPFANALLGIYTTYTQASAKIKQSYFYQDMSWYVQDTWKVTPRLTLDLGMRFSIWEPYHNTAGPESYFNPTLYTSAKAMRIYRPVCVGAATCSSGQAAYRAIDPATVGTPTLGNTSPATLVGKLVPNSGSLTNGLGLTTDGYPKGGLDKKGLLPQPRLGLAWDVGGNRKTVVRGGFGIAYDRYRSDVNGSGANNLPFVLNPTLYYGYLSDIQSGGTGALSPSSITTVDKGGDWPVVYSYSLGVQRELVKDTVIDVSYVGMQTRHLVRTRNLNTIPYGTTFQAWAQDPTRFANGVIPATESGLPSAHQAAGLGFSGQYALATDFLRPYQGYSDITYRSFDSNSTYNSLQVSLQRRFARNLSLGAAYTLSKVMNTSSDETGYTHYTNPRGYDYSLAAFDRRHAFVVNYVWNLPRGSKLIGDHILTRAIFDSWTVSGISTIQSGNPAELGISISGQDAGNRILGTPTSGNLSGLQPRFYVSGSAQSAPDQINLAAFAVPGISDKGPYPRAYLKNPGFINHDLSIMKNFPFGQEGKHYMQLRLEMFNFMNQNQWGGVNRSVNIVTSTGASGANIFNDYKNLQITNNLRPAGNTSALGNYFGEFSSSRDPRIIQLAAKFYF